MSSLVAVLPSRMMMPRATRLEEGGKLTVHSLNLSFRAHTLLKDKGDEIYSPLEQRYTSHCLRSSFFYVILFFG